MKLKKSTKLFLITLLILYFFKGIIYRFTVNYSIINTRAHIELNAPSLHRKIDSLIYEKTLNIHQIIKLTNSLTSEELSFTFNKVTNNANKVLKNKKANCIGYSSLFNSIGNYILKQKKLNHLYKFKHLVGKLTVLGFDLHQFINNPFFRDHDFNEIKNIKTGAIYFVDPSLSDYFYIDAVTCKQ